MTEGTASLACNRFSRKNGTGARLSPQKRNKARRSVKRRAGFIKHLAGKARWRGYPFGLVLPPSRRGLFWQVLGAPSSGTSFPRLALRGSQCHREQHEDGLWAVWRIIQAAAEVVDALQPGASEKRMQP